MARRSPPQLRLRSSSAPGMHAAPSGFPLAVP
jgi:hypothetical protein